MKRLLIIFIIYSIINVKYSYGYNITKESTAPKGCLCAGQEPTVVSNTEAETIQQRGSAIKVKLSNPNNYFGFQGFKDKNTSFLIKKTYCYDPECERTKGVVNYVITETIVTPTIPKEGDIINNERAIELCEYFGYTHLVKRIKQNPSNYTKWNFDGVSGFPDDWHFPPIKNITKIALKHDLKYAYGKETKSGINFERLQADKDFYTDLINNEVTKARALIMYSAVRLGGLEKYNPFWWRWGFARKSTKLLSLEK